MRKYCTFITIAIVLQSSAIVLAQQIQCPKTDDDLEKLRTTILDRKFSGVNTYQNIQFVFQKYRTKCLLPNQKYPSCFDRINNLDRYLDEEFVEKKERERKTEIPEDLKNPNFLKLLDSFSNIDQAIAYIDEINKSKKDSEKYIAIHFTSPHVDGLTLGDNNAKYEVKKRLLIYVPGEWKRFVQYAFLNDDRNLKTTAQLGVAVLAIDKISQNKYGSYLYDYYRNIPKNGVASGRKIIAKNPQDNNCISCHYQGGAPINFPDWQKSPQAAKIEFINKQLRENSAPIVLDNSSFNHDIAPAMGGDYERPDQLIDDCTKDINGVTELKHENKFGIPGGAYQELRAKVKDAMRCASCHKNGPGAIGILRFPMGALDANILQNQILFGSMPKKHKFALSEIEREALSYCLLYEYYGLGNKGQGVFREWLAEEPCKMNETKIESAAKNIIKNDVQEKPSPYADWAIEVGKKIQSIVGE